METIYERIRRLRQENNMSQDELAKKPDTLLAVRLIKLKLERLIYHGQKSRFLPTLLELPQHT